MPDYSFYSIDYSIFSVEITRFIKVLLFSINYSRHSGTIMYGNNAYNKDTFNDILVVQASIITVTKLANNKSLLSQFYCLLNRTTRIAHKKLKHLDYHSALQQQT